MKYLVAILMLFGALAKADVPPDDFEDVKYACRCSCYDYELRPIRVRVVGGGYGYEYMHMPLIDPASGWAEFTLRHVKSRQACAAVRGGACAGLRSYGDARTVPGWLDRCRWDFDSGD